MKLNILTILLDLSAISSALPNKRQGTCANINSGITSARAAEIRAAFSQASLVPQAISTINLKVEVTVSYGGKAANLGNTFSTVETVLTPDISFNAEQDFDPATTKYLILFEDPDAPVPTSSGSPAALSFFFYQATWNTSPRCISAANNGGGEDITIPAYRALTPLSAAQHRYVQLVYRQPANFQRPGELALMISNFDLNGFVRSKGLVNVGAQFFREGLTNAVPI